MPRLLLEAREAVMAHTRPSLRAHGLSDQQWRVLRVLGEHADEAAGVETGRVAREAYLLGPSLTGVLTRMERDGWIERQRCPQDARRMTARSDLDRIAPWAVRYALGRRTYAVHDVVDVLLRNRGALQVKTALVICRDIDEAEARDALGDVVDAVAWRRLRSSLRGDA